MHELYLMTVAYIPLNDFLRVVYDGKIRIAFVRVSLLTDVYTRFRPPGKTFFHRP